ncbi:hypothetical protein BKA63DRAFT_513328 [Paraphoma chrysanthemicola]|nr:hypothetical protein BKA63DRAFT_513328 [Paraphoma chrysanthemicola]
MDRFRRYLIEIIALTLGADFHMLNSALYNDATLKGTDSILSAEEHSELLALSRLVEKVRGQVIRAQKNAVDSRDMEHCRKVVLVLCDILSGVTRMHRFILDLLSWYSQPLAWSVCFNETIPGYWKRWRDVQDEDSFLKLSEMPEASLGSFRCIIEVLVRKEVKDVLAETCYQLEETCGYEEGESPGCFFGALRDGYEDLSLFLQNGRA